jgi:hypothetical protein
MVKMKAEREERKAGMMACLRKMEARLETNLEAVEATDLEANPGEKEAIVERQMPIEEAAIHSLRACRKETMACQETTEARLECKEPTSEDMEPEMEHQEKMDAWIADTKNCRKERSDC